MSESESGSDESGFFKSVADSIKSHVDERLRSPFAGAFLVSWLVVNWKAVFVLLFSQTPIEQRIEAVASAKGYYDVLFHPLWLAAALSIAFYAGSAAFLALLETYGVGRRKIERWFDEIRWVSPKSYLKLKKKYRDSETYLTSLATDNLAQVQEQQERVTELTKEKIAIQQEFQTQTDKLQASLVSLGEAQSQLNQLTPTLAAATTDNEKLSKRDKTHEAVIDKLITSMYKAGLISSNSSKAFIVDTTTGQRVDETWGRLDAALEEIEKLGAVRAQSQELSNDALAALQLNQESLTIYTQRKFPDLPINPSLQGKIIEDISKSGLSRVIGNIGDVDQTVTRAFDAVTRYAKARPDLFTSGTDYIGKAFGLLWEDFRRVHGFSAETMQAFRDMARMVR